MSQTRLGTDKEHSKSLRIEIMAKRGMIKEMSPRDKVGRRALEDNIEELERELAELCPDPAPLSD